MSHVLGLLMPVPLPLFSLPVKRLEISLFTCCFMFLCATFPELDFGNFQDLETMEETMEVR